MMQSYSGKGEPFVIYVTKVYRFSGIHGLWDISFRSSIDCFERREEKYEILRKVSNTKPGLRFSQMSKRQASAENSDKYLL